LGYGFSADYRGTLAAGFVSITAAARAFCRLKQARLTAPSETPAKPMKFAIALFAAVAAAIVGGWVWLGAAVEVPAVSPSRDQKLHCISYAPFRGDQDPFGPDVPLDPKQISEDLARLKEITDCVRTYSIDHGLDRIPAIARQHGMKVLQGLWLSSFPELNRRQMDRAIELAQQFPDVITAVVVGNEALLRGDVSPADLAEKIREVRSKVSIPVTYADVWEFWLRHRELAGEVDFITVHILPYWEDFPIPASQAAPHVEAIRRRVVAAFPGKEIFVGEFGWPSAGRMRDAALPSPIDQARAMHEVVALANRENYRVNLIEAFDQPWKRQLEGTVGGHWGLFFADRTGPKFIWGGSVSNHLHWRLQAAGGVALAAAVFAAAFFGVRQRVHRDEECLVPRADRVGQFWLRIAAMALSSGLLIGWTLANVPLESFGIGGWLSSLVWAVLALSLPALAAAELATGTTVPAFAQILGRKTLNEPTCGRFRQALGILLILLAVLAVSAALGLVFDPRYRDFPFAPLIGATVPLLLLSKWKLRPKAPAAESAMAATLVLSAIYIAFNEGFANWQACWFCAGLLALALILVRVPAAPS
jgi:exo-beta-1,3-glucanase (GH17 family)